MTLNEKYQLALQSVLDGDEPYANLSRGSITPNEVTKYMREHGWVDDLETNGFQWDFWITFRKEANEEYFVLAGDGYYQKEMIFERRER